LLGADGVQLANHGQEAIYRPHTQPDAECDSSQQHQARANGESDHNLFCDAVGAFGLCGVGGVASIRRSTASIFSLSEGCSAMADIIYDFDPRNLPPDYLAAIGLVTAAYAQTENTVEAFIGACLGIDAEYQIAVTTHMPGPLRDHVARAVAEIHIDNLDHLDALDFILDRIVKAAAKRNAIAHHTWAQHPVTGAVFTVKHTARGSVLVESVPQTVEQIRLDAAFIYDAGMALIKFMIALGLEPTLPGLRPRGHKTKAARKARRKKLREERLRGI
jgi:hypothetical protein